MNNKTFPCPEENCSKICKSKGGLKLHRRSKHPEICLKDSITHLHSKLSPVKLLDIINDVVKMIKSDDCFPEMFRANFDKINISEDDSAKFLNTITSAVTSFSGDNERFLVKFHASCQTFTLFKEQIGKQNAALLFHELASPIIIHLSGKEKEIYNAPQEITQKEIYGIQYIGGYIFHKIYSKIRRNKKFHTSENLKSCAEFLKAAKIEANSEEVKSKLLIATLNRGGLWNVSTEAELIFKETERTFRKATSSILKKFDYKTVLDEVVNNSIVIDNFQRIWDKADINVNMIEYVMENVLENIVGLYIRIRMHSFAKDVKEKHKLLKKQNKKNHYVQNLRKLQKIMFSLYVILMINISSCL